MRIIIFFTDCSNVPFGIWRMEDGVINHSDYRPDDIEKSVIKFILVGIGLKTINRIDNSQISNKCKLFN